MLQTAYADSRCCFRARCFGGGGGAPVTDRLRGFKVLLRGHSAIADGERRVTDRLRGFKVLLPCLHEKQKQIRRVTDRLRGFKVLLPPPDAPVVAG